MRVLHINDILAPKGGVETYLLSLLPRLVEAGAEAHVAFGSGNAELWTDSHHIPAIDRASRSVEGELHCALEGLIRRVSPDVVHLHGIQNRAVYETVLTAGVAGVMTGHDYRAICPAANLFYKRSGTICRRICSPLCFPTTLAVHCMTPRPRHAHYFYTRSRYVIHNAARFARVICPSRWAAGRFSLAGFSEDQLVVNPYFCPLTPASHPRQVPEKPTITYLGRGTPTKGWRYFVEALGMLPDVRGLVVGSFKNTEEQLAAVAKRNGCADRLEIRPWLARDDLPRLFAETSVFVFPSVWPETLGIVGLEALACGVPVVASNVGGVCEWLHDGQNGFLVPPKNAAAIADRVQLLLGDRALSQAFGLAALETVQGRFLPEQHVQLLLDTYEQVGGRGR